MTDTDYNATRWFGAWFGCVASCPEAYASPSGSFSFPSTSLVTGLAAFIALLAALIIGLRMNDVQLDDLGSLPRGSSGFLGKSSTALPNHPWMIYFLLISLELALQGTTFALYRDDDGLNQYLYTAVWILHGSSCYALAMALRIHDYRYSHRSSSSRNRMDSPGASVGTFGGSPDVNAPPSSDPSLSSTVPFLRGKSPLKGRFTSTPYGINLLLLLLYVGLGLVNEFTEGLRSTEEGHGTCKTAVPIDRWQYWLFVMALLVQRVPVYTNAVSLVYDTDVSGSREDGAGRKERLLLVLSLLLEIPCVFPNSLWSDVIAKHVTQDNPCALWVGSPYDIVLILLGISLVLRFCFVAGEFKRHREDVLYVLYQQCNETLDQARYY